MCFGCWWFDCPLVMVGFGTLRFGFVLTFDWLGKLRFGDFGDVG